MLFKFFHLPPSVLFRFFKPKFSAPKSKVEDVSKAAIDRVFETLPNSETLLPPGGMDLQTFESRVIVDLLKMSKYLSGDLIYSLVSGAIHVLQ